MTRILVAGIGNIFNGDDGFGVAAIQRLRQRALPEGVDAVDFGIRGLDLTYALLDAYDAAVLVDAAQRGAPPGTLSLVEPEVPEAGSPAPASLLAPHELDPGKVLRLVAALGGTCKRVLLVACEPLTLGGEEGAMGLSDPVAAAIDPAIDLIEEVIDALRGTRTGPRDLTNAIRPIQEGATP